MSAAGYGGAVGHAEIVLLDCGVFRDERIRGEALLQVDEARRRKVADCGHPREEWTSLGVGLLSRFLLLRRGIDPGALRFAPDGRPELEGGRGWLSLSHAGLYAMAGFSDRPIGVDVECYDAQWQMIARHFFTPEEQRTIGEAEDPAACFRTLWSRKEGVIKCSGLRDLRGLSGLEAPEGCRFHEFPLAGCSCVCCVAAGIRPEWRMVRYEQLII